MRIVTGRKLYWAIGTAVLLGAPAAWGHPAHGRGASAADGFAHPLGGWDHVLAMVAVGLWAAQLGGRARWAVPSAFIGAMAIGGAVAAAGVPLAAAEEGVAASVLVFGLLVTVAARVAMPLAAVTVGAFAVFHGWSHVAEMSGDTSPVAYAAGFVAATAMLHGAGLAIGWALQKARRPLLARACGAVVILAAAALWVGAR